MIYRGLDTSNNLNRSQTKDDNGIDIFDIEADNNFETEVFAINGFVEIIIVASSMNTTGTLTYFKSIDNINWIAEKNETNTADFSQTIGNGTTNINDKRGGIGYRKLAYAKGSVNAGTINIKVSNYV